MENAVIYARYSSSGQREESIEGQIRECRQYAEHNGLRVVGEYADHALTGTNDKRPAFQRMIADSAKGQFSAVLVWKFDRFARNRYDSAVYKAKLKKNGVRLLSAKEGIPDSPEGIILESMMEGYAEYYSANLSQNVKRGLYENARKRKSIGGHIPLGLRLTPDHTLEPDPATAPIVKKVFEDYAAGIPAADICRALNAKGYTTTQGNPFNRNSIPLMVRNEKYKGVYAYADIRDENAIPPIVSPELWQKAQIMLKKHHEAPAAKKINGGFLLTGKLFCALCGAPMTGDAGTSRTGKTYSYYTCTNRRNRSCQQKRAPKQWIEDAVVNALTDAAHSDELINTFADRFMIWQEQHSNKQDIKQISDKLRKNKEAYANALSLIDQGLITDPVKQHIRDLDQQRIALEDALAQAKLNSPSIQRSEVVFFLQSFRDGNPSDPSWRVFLVDTFLRSASLSLPPNNPTDPTDPTDPPAPPNPHKPRKSKKSPQEYATLSLTLNYSAPDNTLSVSVPSLPQPNEQCSDLAPLSQPYHANLNHLPFSVSFSFGFLIIQIRVPLPLH